MKLVVLAAATIGLDLEAEEVTALVGAVIVVLSFATRHLVTPVSDPAGIDGV